ncbi:copper resistance protein CopC [Ornithinibacillus sp. JPR2-1]|uniref:copper resistance CopC family protein n=1 Tax=Ornithinibacillus sp. JPR2-1 TaxID=2094019 RepID=UPI0031E26DA9
MKRIFFTIIVFFLVMSVSNSVFAHSHLESSNPADGEVVTEVLDNIVLDFDGGVEQGSIIELSSIDGQAIDLEDITIEDNSLTATLANPLPNGEYQVNWSIVSADGHPVEGEFTFSVNAPETEESEDPAEEPSESTEANEDDEIADSSEQSTDNQESVASDNEEDQGLSSTTIVIIILLISVVAGGLVVLTRRKRD